MGGAEKREAAKGGHPVDALGGLVRDGLEAVGGFLGRGSLKVWGTGRARRGGSERQKRATHGPGFAKGLSGVGVTDERRDDSGTNTFFTFFCRGGWTRKMR